MYKIYYVCLKNQITSISLHTVLWERDCLAFFVVTSYLQVFLSMHPLIETSTYKAILSRAQGDLSASLPPDSGLL